jgi:ribosome-binding factor A
MSRTVVHYHRERDLERPFGLRSEVQVTSRASTATGSFVLKHQHRRRKQLGFGKPDFADGLYGGTSDRLSSGRQEERKTRQFCRQVQRALNLALADRDADDGVNDLFVEEVSPAPDCGHLLVHVVIPADRSIAEALSALRRDSSRLRSEVAMAITRKRAPELSFVPATPDRGGE